MGELIELLRALIELRKRQLNHYSALMKKDTASLNTDCFTCG